MKRLWISIAVSIIFFVGGAHGQQTIPVPNGTGANDTAKFPAIISGIGSNSGTIRLPSDAEANGQTGANNGAGISQDLIPNGSNTIKIGSLSKPYKNIYVRLISVGNKADAGATLNVITDGNNEGNDWIAWFRHEGNLPNNEALIRHQHFSNTQVPLPIFTGIASRGTVASPVALQTNDYLLVLDGRGYDGSGVNHREYAVGFSDTAAQIAFRAAQNWSGTAHGSLITFSTVPNGSTSPAERMRIAQNGNVGIGTNNPGSTLDVGGSITLNGAGSHLNMSDANNDTTGLLTINGSTTASKRFAGAYASNPACVLTPVQDMGATRYWVSTSTTAVTVSVSASGSFRFYYHCAGNPY